MKIDDANQSVLELEIKELFERIKPSPQSRPKLPLPISPPATDQILSSPVKKVATHKLSATKHASSRSAQPVPIPFAGSQLQALQNNSGLLTRALNWLRTFQRGGSSSRRLQVTATASLGEKRFVAVIQVDGLNFLVGGGATGVSLLAQLNGKESFGSLLNKTVTAPKSRIAKPKTAQTSIPA